MRYVYVFSADGLECHQAHLGYEGEIPLATLASRYPGCVVGVFESMQQPGVLAEHLRATIEAGQVVGVAVDPESQTPELWLHVVVTGGSLNPLTGTRYVQRGEQLTYAGAIRETSAPESPVVPAVPGSDPAVALTLGWGLEMVHEMGIDQWSPVIQMTAGEASGVATVPERLADGLYTLPEERLAMIGPYRLRLADPVAWQFKVVDGPAP